LADAVHDRDQLPRRRLTIGERAGFAGVSTRPVWPYHAIGSLPEPDTDASGFRRYEAADVICLVRIVRFPAVRTPSPRVAACPVDLPMLESSGGRRLTNVRRRFHRAASEEAR
jgi:hypothetical protein